MFESGPGKSNRNELNLQHPDRPTITHAVLVVMVGIALIFFFGQWSRVSDVQILIFMRLTFLLVPLWACYMFAFDLHETLFLRVPGWKSFVGVVVGTAAMFLLLFLLEAMLWQWSLLRPTSEQLDQFMQQMNKVLNLDPWYVFLLICVVTPISEEVLFRGFFLRSVKESLNSYMAILLVGILFGIAHFELTIKMILLTIFGIYLCGVVWLSRSLLNSILVHAFYNASALLVSNLSGTSTKPDPFLQNLSSTYQFLGLCLFSLLSVLSLYLFYLDHESFQRSRADRGDLYTFIS
jgi:membrane protease YdiL (CAAX protease family)